MNEILRFYRLDPASRARLRDELFTRHLEVATVDGKAQDQLTAELRHFVDCVRIGSRPRVPARGADAVAVAETILNGVREHAWGAVAGRAEGAARPPRAARVALPAPE